MKLNNRNRFLQPINLLLIVAVILIALIFILNIRPVQPELECYEDQVSTMTIQQVSNLFNENLIEVAWLPENVQSKPIVTTDSFYSYSNPRCYINIKYPHPNMPSKSLLRIHSDDSGSIQLTKMPVDCSWNFTTNLNPTGSRCSFHIDAVTSTLRVNIDIHSDFTPEQILQILDNIRIVEPNLP